MLKLTALLLTALIFAPLAVLHAATFLFSLVGLAILIASKS
jgi:hypothetical protein